jgi:hypothetical protein
MKKNIKVRPKNENYRMLHYIQKKLLLTWLVCSANTPLSRFMNVSVDNANQYRTN